MNQSTIDIQTLIEKLHRCESIEEKFDLYNQIVIHYMNIELNPVFAKVFATQYLEYSKKENSKVNEAEAIKYFGIIARKEGEYVDAFKYLTKALEMYEDLKLQDLIENTNQSIGVLCINLLDFENALNYLHKVYDKISKRPITELNNNKAAILYSNMAICYDKIGKKDLALEYFIKSVEFSNADSESTHFKAKMLMNLGFYYENNDQLDKAKDILLNLVEILESNKMYSSLIHVYNSIIKIRIKNSEPVLPLIKKMENFYQISNYYPGKGLILKLYYLYYEKEGDYKLALSYYKEFNKLLTRDKNIKAVKNIDSFYFNQKLNKVTEQNKDLINLTRILSHDLKEPLRTMTQFSQIANSQIDEKDTKLKFYLTSISDNGTRMQNMIDDLMKLTQLDNIQLKNTEINLKDFFENVKHVLKISIEAKNAIVDIENGLPSIESSENLLFQLFQNIISNGIKYNESEKPLIVIKHNIEEDKLVIHVSDNGIGIPKELIDKIFIPFKRVHKSKKEIKGTGIGLAICKRIIEILKGEISVQSEENKGTTFSVKLPIKA